MIFGLGLGVFFLLYFLAERYLDLGDEVTSAVTAPQKIVQPHKPNIEEIKEEPLPHSP
jgi:hypothetical protein